VLPEKPIGRMLRTEEVAHTGKASLLCDGMQRGGPVQQIEFKPFDFAQDKKPGKFCALAWVYAPQGQESKGTVELSVTPLDEKGGNLPGYGTTVTPTPGKWMLLAVGLDCPAEIEGKKVRGIRIVPIVNGFENGGKVYLDDVGLYRVNPEGR